MNLQKLRWPALIAANVLVAYMLGFLEPSAAAAPKQPFANAVEQREAIITELKELNAQLREQNQLLQRGTIQVVIAEKKR